MDLKTFQQLRTADQHLPDNAFFLYQGKEIIDFVLRPVPGIEAGGSFCELGRIKQGEITMRFD